MAVLSRAAWQLLVVSLCVGCDVTLNQVIPASDLESTERSAFTSDGRLFVIGSRAQDRSDAGQWLVEVTRNEHGGYATRNLVLGALEGTVDGTIGGAPAGDPCVYSGMTVEGMRLYAGCLNEDGRVALIEVDVSASTVRADYFTTCNAEPSRAPCEQVTFYPNGMAVDADGRIYASNTQAHVMVLGELGISLEGSRTLTQIVLNATPEEPGRLSFTHRDWFTTDIVNDGLAPNGVQIEGRQLYYVAGPNLNSVEIREDGSAGTASLYYTGPALSLLDDFIVRDGRMALARVAPPGLVALDRATPFQQPAELGTLPMDPGAIPSSISLQPDLPSGAGLFAPGTLVVTSYFGGGLYEVTGLEP